MPDLMSRASTKPTAAAVPGAAAPAGTAVAAVTDDPAPVTGCTVERIGTMRYHAVAAAFLLDLHRDAAGRIDAYLREKAAPAAVAAE